MPAAEVLDLVKSAAVGLSSTEAQRRGEEGRAERPAVRRPRAAWLTLLGQFKSPITILLVFAATLSLFLHDTIDATIILVIVGLSGLLGFWQEHSATNAVAKLLELVSVTARVRRDGVAQAVPPHEIVPGDVIELAAGATIPADCVLLEARDLFTNEAALTGESFPVEKAVGTSPADAPLSKRSNVVFAGTHVVSGTGLAVVVRIGRRTELGHVAERLRVRAPETEFEHGVRRFGYLLLEVTLLLLIAIFAVNVHLGRPVIDSLLFALALAVGLTPQLLPAIISVNLAHGARRMADQKVIVKRLASIENLGSMTVLCSDKTGTLTEGNVQVDSALDWRGRASERTLRLAWLNARFESGYPNPIDDAIRKSGGFEVGGVTKLDEVPYDFIRKRLSILVEENGARTIVTKGAVANVLSVCTHVECPERGIIELGQVRDAIDERVAEWSARALRVLAVSYKTAASSRPLRKEDECDMTLAGFVLLHDPLKAGIVETVGELGRLGVRLVCVTGDSRLVAKAVGRRAGWSEPVVITGSELNTMNDEALARRSAGVHIFAEVEPNQKERIILALRKSGNVVGYVGDGINDAPAMHAADASISVNTAVDVAKDAADIVLLERGLHVLIEGVREGRRTFVNTLKYVYMATSANFGNMFSMAGASVLLPFLPLLPKQVLTMNLLTDLPEMAIASDSVDPELVDRPRRWNVRSIRRFMVVFGLISSVFDYLTFGVLLLILHATPEQFRTGWFVESVVSAALVVLVIRSRRPFFRSRPGHMLEAATLLVVAATLLVPYSPLALPLGFVPLPAYIVLIMLGLVAAYLVAAEYCKRRFYGMVG